MKTSVLSFILLLISVTGFSQTIRFCTSADEKGNPVGESTAFKEIKHDEALTCLINSPSPFKQTRYVLTIYKTYSTGEEILDETQYVDVHKDWSWATSKVVFNCRTNSGSYKVTLNDLNGNTLSTAKLSIAFVPGSGSSSVYIDPDKVAAFEGIWAAMNASINPQPVNNAEFVFSGSMGNKGGNTDYKNSFSLSYNKTIQAAVYPLNDATFSAGALTFNYFLKTNTTDKPDATYNVAIENKGKSASHEVKLSEGTWVLKVLDASAQPLGSSEVIIVK